MIKAKAAPSAEQIKGFERRINNLLDEKQTVSHDVGEVYDEAKKAGVNTTALRRVIARRRAKAPDPEVVAAMEAYEFALDEAASMVSNGSTSLRKAAADTGFSKSAIHRRASHRNENVSSGTVSDVAPGEDARAAQSLPLPDADDGVSRAGTLPEAETGSATRSGEGVLRTARSDSNGSPASIGPEVHASCAVRHREPQPEENSTDADRLRAQIPASTDPAWLEREASRADDPGPIPARLRRTVSA